MSWVGVMELIWKGQGRLGKLLVLRNQFSDNDRFKEGGELSDPRPCHNAPLGSVSKTDLYFQIREESG